MQSNEMISRLEHELEVSRLERTIDRLNAELSALAAYVITAGPMRGDGMPERATTLAAKVGRIPVHEAAEKIRRIHNAVALSGQPA